MTKATNLSSLRSLRLRLTQAKQAMRPDSLGEHVTVTGKERNKKRTMEQRVRTMAFVEQWNCWTMRKYKKCFLHQNDSKSAEPGRRAQYIFTCVGPKKCHEVPNPKSKIQNLHIKICYITLQNPESKIRNPKSKIRNPKSKVQKSEIQNPKSEIQNQNSPIQNPKPSAELLHNDPKSNIQNPKFPKFGRKSLDFGLGNFGF